MVLYKVFVLFTDASITVVKSYPFMSGQLKMFEIK